MAIGEIWLKLILYYKYAHFTVTVWTSLFTILVTKILFTLFLLTYSIFLQNCYQFTRFVFSPRLAKNSTIPLSYLLYPYKMRLQINVNISYYNFKFQDF